MRASGDVDGRDERSGRRTERGDVHFDHRRAAQLDGLQQGALEGGSIAERRNFAGNGGATMLLNGTYKATQDHILYSDDCRPMFTIIGDKVGRNYPGALMCCRK
jgi:hypothetical protein